MLARLRENQDLRVSLWRLSLVLGRGGERNRSKRKRERLGRRRDVLNKLKNFLEGELRRLLAVGEREYSCVLPCQREWSGGCIRLRSLSGVRRSERA